MRKQNGSRMGLSQQQKSNTRPKFYGSAQIVFELPPSLPKSRIGGNSEDQTNRPRNKGTQAHMQDHQRGNCWTGQPVASCLCTCAQRHNLQHIKGPSKMASAGHDNLSRAACALVLRGKICKTFKVALCSRIALCLPVHASKAREEEVKERQRLCCMLHFIKLSATISHVLVIKLNQRVEALLITQTQP
jgi:hypothetical protein